mgnify:CR=1 FL=1
MSVLILVQFFRQQHSLSPLEDWHVLAGYIAMSIADRPGLVVGFVGGAIAANGKSGFLGALVAGFAAGLIIQLLKKIFDKLPKGLDGLKPVLLYPLLGVLLIGALMTFIIEPPVGALNIAINTGLAHMNGVSSVLLGALVAGMMAVDMGGPLNKAAYVFGTASIAAGLAVWYHQLPLHLEPYSSKINLQQKKEKPDRQTLLWDYPLLQKVQYHLQQRIRCA